MSYRFSHWQVPFRIFLLFLLLSWLAYLFVVNGIIGPVNAWTVVLVAKVLIEVAASVFAVFYLLVALLYKAPTLHLAEASELTTSTKDGTRRLVTPKRIAIVYLCCNDLDKEAVESILSCRYESLVKLIIHDDSTNHQYASEVTQFIEEMRGKYSTEIILVRRSARTGGKPGALNNVFTRYHKDFDYFFICDSDSYITDPDFLNKSLPYFRDSGVALVQLRNLGVTKKEDGVPYKLLSLSIDYWDIFTYFLSGFGWTPFLGHNALIKSEVIEKVGWFSPDQFADDIDFSVKLYLGGYRIVYAREVVCGERHPTTYRALRKRTYKWSFGCTQILRKWWMSIITSKKVSFNEKATFFLTVGFYPLQTLLLVYLFIFYWLLPFNQGIQTNLAALGVYAILILYFTFFPSFVYFLKSGKARDWLKTAPLWGLTYGSEDFVIANALLGCIIRPKRQRLWEPTNSALEVNRKHLFVSILEVLFGISILLVPALKNPILIVLPTTILFSAKFICNPVLHKFFPRSTWGH
jgi:cellulose synthase/poly-beta-1,6-N-acetylglucosamine synthase-like glycosyltransferase